MNNYLLKDCCRLLGSGSFGGGSSLFGSCGHFAAAYAATFAFGSCAFFGTFAGGFGVYLLGFTLFQTFGHGSAYCIENHFDALGSIIVGGDYEVDVRGIGVGVDHSEHGDTETVGFGYGDVLLEYVYYKECGGQTVEVGDAAEVFSSLAR